ncbi:hypothetical protein TSUD_284120 [Trifolium subterraneum]|uniref:DUF7906 domain-containing protein n=1 Tax=Trifolium subterraneum TaxID=3900 RepID=A0A2Z6PDY2_TRISU|nr:hypothetical protein TSUD_284120 [Trifolium subterraneum]
MWSTTTALFLLTLVVSLITTATITTATPIIGLDSHLTTQSRTDPSATTDTFPSLSTTIKKSLSTLPSLSLSLPPIPISLTIHLIGDFPSTTPSLLNSFLSPLPSPFNLITPLSPSLSHSLSLHHTLHLHVTTSHSSSLSQTISQTLTNLFQTTPSPLRTSLLAFPHSSIDKIISQHFNSINSEPHSNPQGFHLYLINLPKPKTDPVTKTVKPYAYTYSSTASDNSSPGFTNCLGTFWTSKNRYFWIDLSAGGVDYGPAISGDGLIPKGEFHPFATLHGRPKSNRAFAADLASIVWSAYQVFLAPSLRIPVFFENKLVVQFIHVYSGEEKDKDMKGLDWKLIEENFRDESNGKILLGDQSLEFRVYDVKYDECPICSFAVSRSINSYTSRFLFDNYTLIVSEYLDSKRLHQILSDSADEMRKIGGIPEEDFGRVVPVYVFDLDYASLLMLDRYHQSVAFKDMVIAVRTRNTQTVSDYSCNGRHVFVHTRELERPIVGSVLQSMWGVSPTHLSWSPLHNSTLVDYTWSMGQTPFGPFSALSSLSFVQKDAARRNVLLTSLNYSISSAVDVLQSIETHGGDRNLLKPKQHDEFVQRWNLFKYKLNKAVSALSHLDYEMALFYLRSSDHDLYAIHSIVYHASQEIEASLVCFKDPPFPWFSVSTSAGAFIALSYVYAKRHKLFRNKRKVF